MPDHDSHPGPDPELRPDSDVPPVADVLPDAPPAAGRREPVPCRLCGQPLTSSVSRRWGIGEDCRRKLRLREAPTPPENPTDQDTLPGL